MAMNALQSTLHRSMYREKVCELDIVACCLLNLVKRFTVMLPDLFFFSQLIAKRLLINILLVSYMDNNPILKFMCYVMV